MRFCDRRVTRWCPGHSWWEQHADCTVWALAHADADESTGSVDWHVWAALYLVDTPDTLPGPAGWSVDIPGGTYAVITENDHGHVHMATYGTPEGAQAAFDLIEREYGLWCDAEDRREQEIMIRSGRIGR